MACSMCQHFRIIQVESDYGFCHKLKETVWKDNPICDNYLQIKNHELFNPADRL